MCCWLLTACLQRYNRQHWCSGVAVLIAARLPPPPFPAPLPSFSPPQHPIPITVNPGPCLDCPDDQVAELAVQAEQHQQLPLTRLHAPPDHSLAAPAPLSPFSRPPPPPITPANPVHPGDDQVAELTMQTEYQLRLKDLHLAERIKELTDK